MVKVKKQQKTTYFLKMIFDELNKCFMMLNSNPIFRPASVNAQDIHLKQ